MAKDKSKDKKGGKAAMASPAKSNKKDKGGDYKLSAPGTGGQFKAEDHVGRLLLITPHEVEHDIKTSNGDANATRADIVVLDEKSKGKDVVLDDSLIFQKVVQGQLREAIAQKSRVVGRLFVDKDSKKAGQSAPYKLAAPSEDEIKLAAKYLDDLDPLR
jgi:hypothetical protein